jgi:hypothetical protein
MNNLKQIGLAMHMFHEARQEICPTYLTANSETYEPTGHATWGVLLLPYLEQRALYEKFDLKKPIADEANKEARATLVAVYFCPTRRSPALTSDKLASTGDYGNVAYGLMNTVDPTKPQTYSGAMMATRAFNAGDGERTIAGVPLGPGDYRAFTNFASVIDGLSNTAFWGEKAVHKDRLGQADPAATHQDGPLYGGKGAPSWNKTPVLTPGEMAYWSRRLGAEKPDEKLLSDTPQTDSPNNRFGSWHPKMSLFLLGDGSVRPVPHTTDQPSLERFGARNDRMTFHLPLPTAEELREANADPAR